MRRRAPTFDPPGQELLQAALALPVCLAMTLFSVEAGRTGVARVHAEQAAAEIAVAAAGLTASDLDGSEARPLEAAVRGLAAPILARTDQAGATLSIGEDDLSARAEGPLEASLPAGTGHPVAAETTDSVIAVRVSATVEPLFGGGATAELMSLLAGSGGASGGATSVTSATYVARGCLSEGAL